MEGQLSNEEFLSSYPNASIRNKNGTIYAITTYGKHTINYWVQYSDLSWTNYDCKTL